MFENSTVNINALCNSCGDMACCLSECVLTFLYAGDNIQCVNEQFVSYIHFFSAHFTLSINVWCRMIDEMLIGPVILDDRMTGQNYLHFLQNELPKQLEDVPLATRIAISFSLLIIPNM